MQQQCIRTLVFVSALVFRMRMIVATPRMATPDAKRLPEHAAEPNARKKMRVPDEAVAKPGMATPEAKRLPEHAAEPNARKKIRVPDEAVAKPLRDGESPWEGLLQRVRVAFTDGVLSNKQLAEHFRMAVQRKGSWANQIPVTVLTVLDDKIASRCKAIAGNKNPVHAAKLVYLAAQSCPSLRVSDDRLWIQRIEPFSPDLIEKLVNNNDGVEPNWIDGALSYEAVCISAEGASSISIRAAPDAYYLVPIAHKLRVPHAGHVFMSRQIEKAPSGTHLFWGVRAGISEISLHQYSDCSCEDGRMRNERASFLVGHTVYGDAILATVGSTWKSKGKCIYEPYKLQSFHRLMLGRTPWGAYKLGRDSLLVADLPKTYTCKERWQGADPKALLTTFCHQHQFPEPQYTYSDQEGNSTTSKQKSFHCKVEVSSAGEKAKVSIYQSDEKGFFRKVDAAQSAALRALKDYEKWCGNGCLGNGQSKEWSVQFQVISGKDIVGDRPPPGSVVSIYYRVNLIRDGLSIFVEGHDEFKFELGEGAVISQVERCVSEAIPGRTLRFTLPAEFLGLSFQASCDLENYQKGWVLAYTVKLLRFEEPMEERIEKAFFSPPLAKQRVEYARTLIHDLKAKTLVDLGCGSGALLEALLKEPNSLEHIIGIDIATKELKRGAKALGAALTKQDAHCIKSITLYEGSISELNPRLCNPDIATCIEVVEHMDPEPLSKLGESVLGRLAPRVWLVSTPNIEYNPIFRGEKWNPASNSLKKGWQQQQTANLRQSDHRFEWTRAEFREWASKLAAEYKYEVRYAGVGGDGADDDNSPGFASQIAIFTRTLDQECLERLNACEFWQRFEAGVDSSPLKKVWQWNVPTADYAIESTSEG